MDKQSKLNSYRNVLSNYTFIPLLLIILSANVYSQVGLGSLAILNQPGLFGSDKYNLKFETGAGYGFFIRHDVYDTNSVKIDLRYSAVILNHKAELLMGEMHVTVLAIFL